jgi:hypothetical protein
MILRGDWKLIHYWEDGRDELYNLKTDPGEKSDVLTDNAEVAKTLRKALDAWLSETKARIPKPDPEYDDAKYQAWLERQRTTVMQQLERQHAAYLEEGWQPNRDWWGSAVTKD